MSPAGRRETSCCRRRCRTGVRPHYRRAGAAAALAIGISEALYNTALGIGTSAIALIMYNVFTTKIDAITYGIDESGFTLTQSFASLYK